MIVNDYVLKMTPEQLNEHINVKKSIWFSKYSTNCYAYALGLDIPEKNICYNAYQPGVISGLYNPTHEDYSYESFLYYLYNDLDTLNIKFREIKPNEEIDENEWKIALFISKLHQKNHSSLDDFHFLRCIRNDVWKHKLGYYGKITNTDDNFNVIYDPSSCHFDDVSYDQTFCLSLKK